MTETQKLIATEVVKQKSRLFNLFKQKEELVYRRYQSPFLMREIKREIEAAEAIEEVLARLLKNVAYAKSLGAV